MTKSKNQIKRENRDINKENLLKKKRASFGKKTITPKTSMMEDLNILIRSAARALKREPNDLVLKKTLEQYKFLKAEFK